MAGMGAILSFTGIMLGLVLVTWAGAMYLRRKLGVGVGTLPPSSLPVVGRRNLDRNRALYVVRIADRYVLLGGSEQSVSLVDHITPEEFAAMCAEDAALAAEGGTPATRLQDAFSTMVTRARSFSELRAAAREGDDGVVDLELSRDADAARESA